MSGIVFARSIRARIRGIARILGVASIAVGTTQADAASPEIEDRVEALTLSLASEARRYGAARAAERAGLEPAIMAMARERRAALLELVEEAPGEALKAELPARFAARLPAAARSLLEYRGEVEGELTVLQIDHEDPAQSRVDYMLTTGFGERVSLHFANRPTGLLTGAQVVARGLIVEDGDAAAMALESGAEGVELAYCCAAEAEESAAAAALPNALGAQKTAVLLVNFADYPGDTPYSQAQAQSLVFGDVGDYIAETSHGRAWLEGDVFGWLTMDITRTCDNFAIIDAADLAATSAGVDLSPYDRLIYVTPEWDYCSYSGVATVGGSPSRAWINRFTLKVVTHELGHGLGLHHAKSLDCGLETYAEDCTSREYGDTIDVMGNTDAGHLSPFQKERLGWIDTAPGGSIQPVDASGIYLIEPLESAPGADSKALRIPFREDPATGATTWLYLSYRQAIGFDGFLADRSFVACRGDVTDGVVANIGTGDDGQSSHLLNMKTDSCFVDKYNRLDWQDPALAVGSSFTDATSGLVVSVVDTFGGVATVSVDMDAIPLCAPGDPIVSATPVGDAWAAAGDTVDYSVAVTSTDSLDCDPRTYVLSASPPSGWSALFAEGSLPLAPGASDTTTLSLTSASDAVDGSYDVLVTASNGADSGSAVATYVVSTPAANQPPVASDDSAETTSGSSIVIGVLANDFDPDGDPLAVVLATQPGKGDVEINPDGTITYTAAGNAKGSDQFGYTISDGAASASANVAIAFTKGGGGGGGGGGKGNGKNK